MRWLSCSSGINSITVRSTTTICGDSITSTTPVETGSQADLSQQDLLQRPVSRKIPRGSSMSPWGSTKTPRFVTLPLLKTASAILQRADIAELPFEMILDWPLSRQDFVYFDPAPITPSVSPAALPATTAMALRPATRSVWPMCFGNWPQRGIPVMLSNSDCDLVRKLYTRVSHPPHPGRQGNQFESRSAGQNSGVVDYFVLEFSRLPRILCKG